MSKVLVLGGGGQLGVELVREFAARGHEVRGLKRTELDITHEAQVEDAVTGFDPAIVINAAAYNQVDLAEKHPLDAFQANSMAVRNLAMACRQNDARFVHFSTDYVFDGTKGSAYGEEDATHPLGAYAVSKLCGEIYAQAYLDDPLIIRTSGVFGPGGLHTARGNFVELMLRMATEGQVIRVVEDHVASPTYAPTLAARTADLVEQEAKGVFHIGGGTAVSWFEYAALIFRLADLHPELKPTNEREYRTAARRPKYSALSNGKMERLGLEPFPGFDVVVADYLKWRQA